MKGFIPKQYSKLSRSSITGIVHEAHSPEKPNEMWCTNVMWSLRVQAGIKKKKKEKNQAKVTEVLTVWASINNDTSTFFRMVICESWWCKMLMTAETLLGFMRILWTLFALFPQIKLVIKNSVPLKMTISLFSNNFDILTMFYFYIIKQIHMLKCMHVFSIHRLQ